MTGSGGVSPQGVQPDNTAMSLRLTLSAGLFHSGTAIRQFGNTTINYGDVQAVTDTLPKAKTAVRQ